MSEFFERYKSPLDPMVEMANLNSSKIGLTSGFIYISTAEGGYGPRIKYYRKLGKTQPYTGVSIADSPEIYYDDLGISRKERLQVFKFIVENKEVLLKFWNEGDTWDSDKVEKTLKNFKKVNEESSES